MWIDCNVDWRVAGLLAAGSVPATVLTIWVLSRVPKQSPTTATIISVSMGVALIIAAVAIFFRRRIRDYALARADNPTRTRYSGPITVVFGAVLGVLVSLYSVGAGALGVAVLFFLYPRLPPDRGGHPAVAGERERHEKNRAAAHPESDCGFGSGALAVLNERHLA